MLLWLRKILFYLLLAFYFVVTPYTIFYALGYVFNPREVELVKTGLISLTTYPKSATVFVEGKKFSDKTPTIVRDLLPGHYTIRIVHKGYDSWEKTVTIYPEKATRLEPVLLMPRKPEREIVSARSYAGMIPRLIDSKIIAWSGGDSNALWKIDLFFKKETQVIFAEDSKKIKILRDHSKENSNLVLFEIKKNGEKRYWALDLDHEKRESKDFDSLIPADFDAFDWDPKDSSRIYFLKNGVLSKIDLRHGMIQPEVATDVLGFGAKHQHLYLLKKDFSLLRTSKQGDKPESLIESPDLSQKIFGELAANHYRIEVFKTDLLQKDLIFFLSNHGALVTNRLPYHLVGNGVRGIEYAPRSEEEKLLFWTEKTIGVIQFVRDSESLFEKGPAIHMIYRAGKNIQQAFWSYDDSHIVFLDQDEIRLLESEGPEPYLARPIDTVKGGSHIFYNDRNHSLYFLDAANGNLIKRKLVD